ncbi:MAG TPA: DUF6085 family protein [Mycobacteriales bacterium]|nr:DUF6085 family protein [Mycobacteriales bacterium]
MTRVNPPRVKGYCPVGCDASLYLDEAAGQVVCGNPECPWPTAATAILTGVPPAGPGLPEGVEPYEPQPGTPRAVLVDVDGTYDVTAVFDDRAQVVQAWRAIGLTVFAVADGQF